MSDRELELLNLMRQSQTDQDMVCAMELNISPERAKAILAERGYHAHEATRFVDALAIVREAVLGLS